MQVGFLALIELNNFTIVFCFIAELNLFIIHEFCNIDTVIELNRINTELTPLSSVELLMAELTLFHNE